METLKYLGVAIGLLANIPLFIAVYKGLYQNFSTWILWTLLDVIATISIIHQHGNWQLSGCYIFTSFAMSILLLYKKEIDWGIIDTLTAIAVFICLIVWYLIGDKAATIASTTAVVISSFPLIMDTYLSPDKKAARIYFAFVVASALSLLSSESWSVEKSLYPACTMGFSTILTIFALRTPKPLLKTNV